jgi:hypothetical protein
VDEHCSEGSAQAAAADVEVKIAGRRHPTSTRQTRSPARPT